MRTPAIRGVAGVAGSSSMNSGHYVGPTASEATTDRGVVVCDCGQDLVRALSSGVDLNELAWTDGAVSADGFVKAKECALWSLQRALEDAWLLDPRMRLKNNLGELGSNLGPSGAGPCHAESRRLATLPGSRHLHQPQDWYPDRHELREAEQRLLMEAGSQDADAFSEQPVAEHGYEVVVIQTPEEWEHVAQSISETGEVQRPLRLRRGAEIEKGWVLREFMDAAGERTAWGAGRIQLPISLLFEVDDEAETWRQLRNLDFATSEGKAPNTLRTALKHKDL